MDYLDFFNIFNIFTVPKTYIDIVNENISNIKNIIIEFNNTSEYLFLNNLTSIAISLSLVTLILISTCIYYYNNFNDVFNIRLNELCNLKIKENEIILSNNKENNNYFYLNSLNEIIKNKTQIISKLNADNDNNYIVVLRIKMKYYFPMINTKYELHSKNIKYTKFNDFITKDMYMIMGIQFSNIKDDKNIIKIIVSNINYLNSISEKEYINEDFIVISISNCNTINNFNITNEITKGFHNIKYELFNLRDAIIKINESLVFKYSLTLPIYNIYNMLMDTCNNTIFESKMYSIDNNNIERWNGVSLNEIEHW